MATKLTDAKLKGLKRPESGQVEHADSDVPGLRARIGKTGAITFILRRRVGGTVKNITVGRYGPRFGLADARKRARVLISDLEAGKPLPERRPKASAGLTIRGMLSQYLADKSHLRSIGEVERILRTYVLPELGDRMADAVTRGEVTALIDGIAAKAPTMARAVHAQLSAFYSWALPALDRLPANPCIGARRPDKPRARDRVLSEDEVAALWRIGDAEGYPWGIALQLLILTGARRDEVFSADRDEFDLKAREWILPPERAKNGVAHLLPLSPAAVALLKSIPEGEGGKLFAARGNPERGASGFSKVQTRWRAALDKELKRKSGPHWQLHDIRRTVATGLQRLGVRYEVTEAVLNHVSGARGGIAGVYQRHDWKSEKRAALDAWARHVHAMATRKKPASNVVKLGAA